MKFGAILACLRQKTSIMGIATIAGVVAAVVAHQITYDQAVPAIAVALTLIVVPENPALQGVVKQIAVDGIGVYQSRGLGGSTLALGADLVTAAGLLHPDTPVVAVATSVTPIAPADAPKAPMTAIAAALVGMLLFGGAWGLVACTPQQAATAVADGQLVCKVGSAFMAMTSSANGGPVLAMGASKTFVDAACALINGVATSLNAVLIILCCALAWRFARAVVRR